MLLINIFFQRQIDIYTYSTTKHTFFFCITTIAYDKSIFPYCDTLVLLLFFLLLLFRVRTGGETNNTQGCKQGGRRYATEKTASDANMIVHLNNGEIHQAPARLLWTMLVPTAAAPSRLCRSKRVTSRFSLYFVKSCGLLSLSPLFNDLKEIAPAGFSPIRLPWCRPKQQLFTNWRNLRTKQFVFFFKSCLNPIYSQTGHVFFFLFFSF